MKQQLKCKTDLSPNKSPVALGVRTHALKLQINYIVSWNGPGKLSELKNSSLCIIPYIFQLNSMTYWSMQHNHVIYWFIYRSIKKKKNDLFIDEFSCV